MAENKGDSATTLSAAQSRALFDILTHCETYAEIEDFKQPGAISKYGPPFQTNLPSTGSGSPILQALLANFALTLPGLQNVSDEFWTVRVNALIEELSQAELSESYDKGILGVRKTLATAISALLEYPARGSFAGVPKAEKEPKKDYDVKNPNDVMRSWHDALQGMVYGNLVDELFAKAAETDDLTKHSGLVQAMHEFVVVNLASLMHYALILSPEGPTMLRMISSVHSLLPYMAIRQALKIGNVATMISAVMRIILAKASVATVTNWLGVTSGADEGQNLLQQIISQVLGWDRRDLKKRADKIEKDKTAPPKEVLSSIRNWISDSSRAEHEECRRQSRESGMSIVAVIMATSPHSVEMNDTQHAKALEYLALQLGVRDRQEIVRVLCHNNPDHVTAAIRDGVDAYTPMIRHVHQAVNLADTVWDFERFVTDMLKMSKPKKEGGKEVPPSVEDYVDLIHRHQSSSHKFLHQVAKNGKEVTKWWQDYVHKACSYFKPPAVEPSPQQRLESAFNNLSHGDQEKVRKEIDAWSKYLDDLHSASASRIAGIIKRTGSTRYGPGAYLARWQHFLDNTLITPDKLNGAVRYGASKTVKEESMEGLVDTDGAETEAAEQVKTVSAKDAEKVVEKDSLATAPSVEMTVKLLGPKFRENVQAAGG